MALSSNLMKSTIKAICTYIKIFIHHLHIRPCPRVGELVYIYISCCESLQGQLRLSVIIQDGLPLNEGRK